MTSFFNYLRSKMKKDKNNSEEKEQYELECSFVFKGKFYIKANSEEEVIDIFRNQCNLMIGGGISTNDKERQKIVSWHFDEYPIKQVHEIEKMEKDG